METALRLPELDELKIAVIGLGYVGLPLAVEFGKQRDVVGFDIDQQRIDALRRGEDRTLETEAQENADAKHLRFTTDLADLVDRNLFIVTVPTPIDAHRRPDLTPLIRASETVGKVLKGGDVVVYESTVYPGATEEDCAPVLERVSGLVYNPATSFAATAPSASIPATSDIGCRRSARCIVGASTRRSSADHFVDALYASIITAGTYKAESDQGGPKRRR